MLLGARVLVGNSSVGIRECSFLGVPVVNIGTRQSGRERGPNVIDVPHDVAAIREAVDRQIAHGPYESSTLYGDGHAGERIAAVLAGQAQEAAA
jgi:UDP-N-acetylglucosamine 2-epimerase